MIKYGCSEIDPSAHSVLIWISDAEAVYTDLGKMQLILMEHSIPKQTDFKIYVGALGISMPPAHKHFKLCLSGMQTQVSLLCGIRSVSVLSNNQNLSVAFYY